MKKLTAILCLLLLTAVLPGCGVSFTDDAAFYYKRSNFDYYAPDPVIVAEQRDVTGHSEDLSFLLNLYLMGPLDKELVSPFPIGTQILGIERQDSCLTITITDTSKTLSDSGFLLACTCLSKTCMELPDVSEVTIVSGSRSAITGQDEILLTDTVSAHSSAESEELKQ